ncbi:hypothetical protein EV424DRAFT_634391 [Suillus variegatus]|nr:hypothetical protein EV424DRAFT_634391 [Suillus variegatus]
MISAESLLLQLPQDVLTLARGVLDRSVTDFQQLCDRIADCSVTDLWVLQPVFYMHLDTDHVPSQSTPAVTTDIELARWSLVGIVTTLSNIDVHAEKRCLLSAWNCIAPWLLFFHNQFIMCGANYRPIDRTPAIKLVASMLFHGLIAGRDSDGNSKLATTPILFRPIAELWMLAIETKDEDVLNIQMPLHDLGRITSLRLVTIFLAGECMRSESFVNTLVEVAGGIGPFTSAALKYVKAIASVTNLKDPDITSEAVRIELIQVVTMFSTCVGFITGTSMQSAAIREGFIVRHSIRHIFSTLRILQPLIPGRGSTEKALASSFQYLFFLLERADVPVSVFHEALRARALEIAVRMAPFEPVKMEANLHNISADFFEILYHYLVHDKILTYTCKHVNTWSNTLGPIARQDENLWKDWSAMERTIRSYVSLRSKEEMIRRPLSNEKGWFLKCYCSGITKDIQLRQCAGCQVVRYCSKQCQRDSWYSHHRLSCKFLKAAVGSSTPHYVKRSLRLLAALEDRQMSCQGDDDIPKLVVAARQQYPTDQERLVVELGIDKLDVSVRPLRHYLFLFNGLSENDIVESLSSWNLKEPRVHRSFLCSVIAINDQYYSRQILFSPRTALNMEMKLGRKRQ